MGWAVAFARLLAACPSMSDGECVIPGSIP